MTATVKIGNSWYVLDDICGIIGPQDIRGPQGTVTERTPPKLLMRGGHILSMAEMSEEVVEHIRQLRDPVDPSVWRAPQLGGGAQPEGEVTMDVEAEDAS